LKTYASQSKNQPENQRDITQNPNRTGLQVIKPQRRNILSTGQKVQNPHGNQVRPAEGRGHDNHEFLHHQRDYSKNHGQDEEKNWLGLVPDRTEEGSSHNRSSTRAQQEDAEKKQPNTENSTDHCPDDGTQERDSAVARGQGQSNCPPSSRASNKPDDTQADLEKAISPKTDENPHCDSQGSTHLTSPCIDIHGVTISAAVEA